MKFLKSAVVATTVAAALGGLAVPAQAANWTMLQGTEPSDAAGRIKVWGFVQPTWQKDDSEPNKYVGTLGNNFEYVAPKLLGPDFESQEGFNIRRARLGARGAGLPLDANVNYFLLAEFGNNAVTHGDGSSAKLTDASVTLNHIPGARVRVGAFKVPTFEEGYQAIHVFDYIDFTTVGNQLMLERYPNKQYKLNRNNQGGFSFMDGNNESPYNQFDQPVGAFRDVGLQVFDSFIVDGDLDLTYALMYGNGNGVNFSDNDDNKDIHAYFSIEKIFGGKGPRREGWKTFIWSQNGTRTLYNPAVPYAGAPASGVDTEPGGKQEYDRKRYGIGTKFLKDGFRVTVEYLKGEGMIFLGPDNPTFTITGPVVNGPPPPTPQDPVITDTNRPLLADGRKGEAEGYYLDFGYRLPGLPLELDLRYDFYDRLTDATQLAGPCAFNFQFETLTLGAQWHFNKKTRLTANVAERDFEAVECPDAAPGGNPNNNLEGVGRRYGLQVTHIF